MACGTGPCPPGERSRQRWRRWGVVGGLVATAAAVLVTLVMLAVDPSSVPIVGIVAGDLALGVWVSVVPRFSGSAVERGEQMAIGQRSANLRRRGYDQLWTHAQWKAEAN